MYVYTNIYIYSFHVGKWESIMQNNSVTNYAQNLMFASLTASLVLIKVQKSNIGHIFKFI